MSFWGRDIDTSSKIRSGGEKTESLPVILEVREVVVVVVVRVVLVGREER